MSKFCKLQNIIIYKKQFVMDYLKILNNDYNNNRTKLTYNININKDNINTDILKRYYYFDDDIFEKELNKFPIIKEHLYRQIELNHMINVGDILYNDIEKYNK